MSEPDTRIRRADGLDDIAACMELQREVWEFAEPRDMAPPPLLILAGRFGGSVLMAESANGRAVGFSYALLCRDADGSLFWWSHMTAVRPDHQARNVGFRLKLAQRTAALDAGIDRIRWTFDPLQALNAHFNIRKLGVRVIGYENNIYGNSSSPLHHGMPTDRLLVEWDLKPGPGRGGGGVPSGAIPENLDALTRAVASEGPRAPRPVLGLEETPVAIEIPADIGALLRNDPASARQWQRALATACSHYLERRYHVTDFLRVERTRTRAMYVLEKRSE